jgi:hypothetical protein
MATLPRYQQLGIQYADLPRISTAGIEVGAKAMDVMGSQIDRMVNFVYEQGVTDVQRKAQQYAIENPLTKQQVDEALATDKGVAVPGAGRIFQQSYEKVQAGLLSTELQLQANKAFTAVKATIDSGQPFNLKSIETEIKDMVDGYTSTVMALDPDQGLRFKAAVTTAGNAVYQRAADRAQKIYQAGVIANYEQALTDVEPVLEAIIAKAGSIDPQTGQPIDIELLIETQRRPFADSLLVAPDKNFLGEFNKKVMTAKKGALTSFLTDRTVVQSPSDAINRINRGDFGNLSPIYKNLPQKEKDAVRDDVIKSFAAEYQATQQAKKLEDDKNKETWTALSLEYINPNTSSARKRQIANEGVRLNQITLQQAQDMLQPPGAKTDSVLYSQLYDQIQRGSISSYQDLIPYRGRLSDSDFRSLSTAATNTQGRAALSNIRTFVGIRENQFVSEDKNAKEKVILQLYNEELGKQVKNDQGVLVYQTPTEAADKAIDRFKSNKLVQDAVASQERIKGRVEKAYQDAGVPMPNVPIESIDVNMIRDKKLREQIISLQRSYRDSVRGMAGQ